MARFVLVHGAWHGAWCWYKVVPALERLGHAVQAIDLPGHGVDRTPLADVTLDAYVDRVGEAIARAGEPVMLVGHFSGRRTVLDWNRAPRLLGRVSHRWRSCVRRARQHRQPGAGRIDS